MSRLDAPASSQYVCLLACCLSGDCRWHEGLEESVKKEKRQRVKVKERRTVEWWGGRMSRQIDTGRTAGSYWKLTRKGRARGWRRNCENSPGTNKDKEWDRQRKSNSLKLKSRGAAESGANLFNHVAMGKNIYDECVVWLWTQLPTVQPADTTWQPAIRGEKEIH